MSPKEHWKSEPDDHDYPAAENYLSLLLQEPAVDVLVGELRAAPLGHWKAKDLLREPAAVAASGKPPRHDGSEEGPKGR